MLPCLPWNTAHGIDMMAPRLQGHDELLTMVLLNSVYITQLTMSRGAPE
jgi:hypothetical protein